MVNLLETFISFLQAFDYPSLRRNLLCSLWVWFAFAVGYYGAVYNTPPLGFNPQLVFAFPAFLTLPVVLASPIAENRREFL